MVLQRVARRFPRVISRSIIPRQQFRPQLRKVCIRGATYYKPDSGPESLIAQIGGFLYQFIINGDVVTVKDISIPGDPNPATATQAWLWQAENFVIVNDGISLPIFFDGNTSRRSQGVTQVVGTVTGGEVIPAIGATFSVALTTPYTGIYNVPVLIDGDYYQPIADCGGYAISAVNRYDTPGTPIPIGTEVIVKPSVAFVMSANTPLAGNFVIGSVLVLPNIATTAGLVIGQEIILLGKIWTVTGIPTGDSAQLTATQAGFYSNLAQGTEILYSGVTSPNVVIGTVTANETAPAIGAAVQLLLSNTYSGAAGQLAYIGTGQYTITSVPAPPPSGLTLCLVNISAPAGNLVAADIITVPELPAGRMGAYGHAQNWMSLVDGISFVCSDISGAASGTPAYQYRDAVLKTTAITFGAGNFRIPSAGDIITSMTFGTNLDVSMGQGPLMIGTARYIFSCVAPVDASNLASIITKGSPILTYALVGRGPLAQNSTINVNSDIQFRSTVGLGSLLIARQQFTSSISGNTPISEEMVRIFNDDNQQLLPYSSAINFDNRSIFTASPQASSQGVFHTSLVAMNLDGLSSLRGKEPACYDGQWTGINTLQLLQGLFAGTSRAFAFTFNVTLSKIEIYELLPTGTQHFDNGNVPITWAIETPSLMNRDVKPDDVLVQLNGGEFAVDEVRGTVRFQIFYKPDQYGAYGEASCWVPWHSFSVCAAAGSKPLYFPRLGLPEPSSSDCVAAIDTPARNAYTFQVRIIVTGMCRLLRLRIGGVTLPIPKFVEPTCDVIETVTV